MNNTNAKKGYYFPQEPFFEFTFGEREIEEKRWKDFCSKFTLKEVGNKEYILWDGKPTNKKTFIEMKTRAYNLLGNDQSEEQLKKNLLSYLRKREYGKEEIESWIQESTQFEKDVIDEANYLLKNHKSFTLKTLFQNLVDADILEDDFHSNKEIISDYLKVHGFICTQKRVQGKNTRIWKRQEDN